MKLKSQDQGGSGPKIIVVSNRLPFTVKKKGLSFKFTPSSGGLASGLGSYVKQLSLSKKIFWVGWPGAKIEIKDQPIIVSKLKHKNSYPIFLNTADIKHFYEGFCNQTIWPLFHGLISYTKYQKEFWDSYKKINEVYCQKVLELAKSGDTIFIHDYHLMLLPELLRQKLPDLKIGFFLHVPFPTSQILQYLPEKKRTQILLGLLGADLIGFHTTEYTQNFFTSVQKFLNLKQELGTIRLNDRIIKAESFPIGINYKKFSKTSKSQEAKKEKLKWDKLLGEEKIILSLDRLDYTKGIVNRLDAYQYLLSQNPNLHGKIKLALIIIPSREEIKDYKKLKSEVDRLVIKINKHFGNSKWQPIYYRYQSLGFAPLVALYRKADIGLVTPIKDGMNLIAKEYLASKGSSGGTLILSETAGAAKELFETELINPHSKEEIVEAILKTLDTPKKSQVERNRVLQKKLQQNTIFNWGDNFLNTLNQTKQIDQPSALYLNKKHQEDVANDFLESKHRLILLDYDGTLVPFVKNPIKASPDKALYKILKKLSEQPNTKLVIISGRDKHSLNLWFGKYNFALAAEHGVHIKDAPSDWRTIKPLRQSWKMHIKPVLERYTRMLPGTQLEEKDYSLVWHYRAADPATIKYYRSELLSYLQQLTLNTNLEILTGSKVIEVKKRGIDKGVAASYWINKDRYEFILAIGGDDTADQALFKSLPFYAHSIQIGSKDTSAKFYINDYKQGREILKRLANAPITKFIAVEDIGQDANIKLLQT